LFLDPGPDSPSFISEKMWKLHGTKCRLYSTCHGMVSSNCSIASMTVRGLRWSFCSKTVFLCFRTVFIHFFKVLSIAV
jgi:hypothetical protein